MYREQYMSGSYVKIPPPSIPTPDNGLAPNRQQAIIWTSAGVLSIEPSGTKFSEILAEIHNFLFTKNASENIVWKKAVILSRGMS